MIMILQNINLWISEAMTRYGQTIGSKTTMLMMMASRITAVGLTAFGNRAAYLFEMLTEEPDTLVGFDIYYPDYGVPSNLIVDFAIYNDINGLPGIPIYTLPSYTITRNGNKFKRIKFGEPVSRKG